MGSSPLEDQACQEGWVEDSQVLGLCFYGFAEVESFGDSTQWVVMRLPRWVGLSDFLSLGPNSRLIKHQLTFPRLQATGLEGLQSWLFAVLSKYFKKYFPDLFFSSLAQRAGFEFFLFLHYQSWKLFSISKGIFTKIFLSFCQTV